MVNVPRRCKKINTLVCASLVLILFLASAMMASAGPRVALLIGNSNYQLDGLDLANPVNDVNALGSRLTDLGFETRTIRDAGVSDMGSALDWLATKARGAEMAMVFYAGHGVQLNGENYLIASDLAGFSQGFMTEASLTLSSIKSVLDEASPEIGIIVLDACRNNPFSATAWAEEGLAVASGGTGLLVAYATDPGNVAFDGTGDNSVFTEALLDNIGSDGLDVRIMFGRVRQDVVRKTDGAQIPWVEESVLGEHYFGDPNKGAVALLDDEVVKWRSISTSTDPAAFRAYLESHPDGLFSGFAKARIEYLENPTPYQPITGDRSSAVILASVDPDLAAASLGILGYIPETRGLTPVSPELLEAFDAYRATLPDPQAATAEQLHTDAARLTIFLAAATGQRIRTDLAALTSVETTLKVANDAFAQLVAAAGDDPAYKPIVDEARADVVAIEEAKTAIETRLDGSRTYYETLVLAAQDNYQTLIKPELLTGQLQSRSLNEVTAQLGADASLFMRHVQLATTRTRGSYAWMNDFIGKS